ncbi:hypothetical protein ABWK22_13100 [Gottfriedia acidiceleris]|uniref:hypothetical protein n=1 Tax=Gottfriedia acidiceleris TaxID=371036 RepID=UPI00339AE91A
MKRDRQKNDGHFFYTLRKYNLATEEEKSTMGISISAATPLPSPNDLPIGEFSL